MPCFAGERDLLLPLSGELRPTHSAKFRYLKLWSAGRHDSQRARSRCQALHEEQEVQGHAVLVEMWRRRFKPDKRQSYHQSRLSLVTGYAFREYLKNSSCLMLLYQQLSRSRLTADATALGKPRKSLSIVWSLQTLSNRGCCQSRKRRATL